MKLAPSVLWPLAALAGACVAAAACTAPVPTQGIYGGVASDDNGGLDSGTASGSSNADGGSSTGSPAGPAPVASSTPSEDAAATCNIDYEPFTFDQAPDGGTATHGVWTSASRRTAVKRP